MCKMGRTLLVLAAVQALGAAAAWGAGDSAPTGWAPVSWGQSGWVQVSAREAYHVPVPSMQVMRFILAFRRTVHQQYDFSCGSAAVATLLTYQYGRPTTEAAVFQQMYATGNQAQIRKEGFSLLDMKRYLDSLGYVADGVRVPLSTLIEIGVPAIALIADHGYRHFVVVKGANATEVILGDPAVGRRVMSRRAFRAARIGNLFFVIRNDLNAARFNLPADWASPTAPPLATSVPRYSLALEFLEIPSASRF